MFFLVDERGGKPGSRHGPPLVARSLLRVHLHTPRLLLGNQALRARLAQRARKKKSKINNRRCVEREKPNPFFFML